MRCPSCGSQRVWKDGIRYVRERQVQRYICRSCGYRFSEPQSLNSLASYNGGRRVCVSLAEGTKNLVEVESRTERRAAGATKEEVKGAIISFAWTLQKQGYAEVSIRSYVARLKNLVKHGVDLFDPDSVKEVIAKRENWSNSTKSLAVAAYSAFASINGIEWSPPKYKRHRKLPFLPLEKELDSLIASCGKKTSTLLQLLKETGMRIGEALRLNWTDIDFERNIIMLNLPEKGGEPRVLKASRKLFAMLDRLPKTSEKVFSVTRCSASRTFQTQRRRAAIKLGNPRLSRITFHTFRHWKATTLYHQTKDILYVMQFLGHKNIQNTLIYTQLIDFEKEEEYHSATAQTTEQARQLIEAGFEYVCTTPEETMLFRKRK